MSSTSTPSKDSLAAYAELARRQRRRDKLSESSFPAQRAFLDDPSPLKATQCSRRAGKTYGDSLLIVTALLKYPRCNVLYTGLTKENARRMLMKDCLEPVLNSLGIKYKYNKVQLTVELEENGSVLYMLGVDADDEERNKALGLKYALVVIDEAQSLTIDQRDLVYRVLKPAVADLRGQIVLSGTPDNNTFTLFFEITTGLEPGWSVHKWSAFDNPHMRIQWQAEIEEHRQRDPDVDKRPWFRQMYLNEWVIDESKLVYRYNPQINRIESLPTSGNWFYTLGIDLGWDDHTAFTRLGYRDYDRATYVCRSWKRQRMLLSDVEDEIRAERALHPTLNAIVIDNSDKQSVEEIQSRLGIRLIPADKAGKYDFIQILNTEYQLGNIKIVGPECEPLIAELTTLVWDEKKLVKKKHVELSSAANHCTDSHLYGWRYTYSYVDRGLPPRALTLEQEIEEMEDAEAERLRQENDRAWWEKSL